MDNSVSLHVQVLQLKTFLKSLDPCALCFITGQNSLENVQKLSNKKRVCEKAAGTCVAVFTKDMENELKMELKKVNLGYCILTSQRVE